MSFLPSSILKDAEEPYSGVSAWDKQLIKKDYQSLLYIPENMGLWEHTHVAEITPSWYKHIDIKKKILKLLGNQFYFIQLAQTTYDVLLDHQLVRPVNHRLWTNFSIYIGFLKSGLFPFETSPSIFKFVKHNDQSGAECLHPTKD